MVMKSYLAIYEQIFAAIRIIIILLILPIGQCRMNLLKLGESNTICQYVFFGRNLQFIPFPYNIQTNFSLLIPQALLKRVGKVGLGARA